MWPQIFLLNVTDDEPLGRSKKKWGMGSIAVLGRKPASIQTTYYP